MFTDRPYFMKNKSWYKVDVNGERGYVLTEKAPQKAIESYEEFYRKLESVNKCNKDNKKKRIPTEEELRELDIVGINEGDEPYPSFENYKNTDEDMKRLTLSEYSEEVKKHYLNHFSEEQFDSAEQYFMSDEVQKIIKERFEMYTTNILGLRGAGEPEAVAECLSLMW